VADTGSASGGINEQDAFVDKWCPVKRSSAVLRISGVEFRGSRILVRAEEGPDTAVFAGSPSWFLEPELALPGGGRTASPICAARLWIWLSRHPVR